MAEGEKFRVIIAGSRDFTDYDLLEKKCNKILSKLVDNHVKIVIISGHARGTDKLGEQYADEYGFECDIHPADWDKYGKRAGYRRNEEMSEVADGLIAFWDGESRGTKHMIDIAKEKKLKVRVINYKTA